MTNFFFDISTISWSISQSIMSSHMWYSWQMRSSQDGYSHYLHIHPSDTRLLMVSWWDGKMVDGKNNFMISLLFLFSGVYFSNYRKIKINPPISTNPHLMLSLISSTIHPSHLISPLLTIKYLSQLTIIIISSSSHNLPSHDDQFPIYKINFSSHDISNGKILRIHLQVREMRW